MTASTSLWSVCPIDEVCSEEGNLLGSRGKAEEPGRRVRAGSPRVSVQIMPPHTVQRSLACLPPDRSNGGLDLDCAEAVRALAPPQPV